MRYLEIGQTVADDVAGPFHMSREAGSQILFEDESFLYPMWPKKPLWGADLGEGLIDRTGSRFLSSQVPPLSGGGPSSTRTHMYLPSVGHRVPDDPSLTRQFTLINISTKEMLQDDVASDPLGNHPSK